VKAEREMGLKWECAPIFVQIPGGRNRVRKEVLKAKMDDGYYITSVMVTVEYNAMYFIVIDLRLISSYGECS